MKKKTKLILILATVVVVLAIAIPITVKRISEKRAEEREKARVISIAKNYATPYFEKYGIDDVEVSYELDDSNFYEYEIFFSSDAFSDLSETYMLSLLVELDANDDQCEYAILTDGKFDFIHNNGSIDITVLSRGDKYEHWILDNYESEEFGKISGAASYLIKNRDPIFYMRSDYATEVVRRLDADLERWRNEQKGNGQSGGGQICSACNGTGHVKYEWDLTLEQALEGRESVTYGVCSVCGGSGRVK